MIAGFLTSMLRVLMVIEGSVKGHCFRRPPAMALGLTDRLWQVTDLLHFPVPQAA